ncbi:hypothetical protein NPIL_668041, partial [Nephila pilipes]
TFIWSVPGNTHRKARKVSPSRARVGRLKTAQGTGTDETIDESRTE